MEIIKDLKENEDQSDESILKKSHTTYFRPLNKIKDEEVEESLLNRNQTRSFIDKRKHKDRYTTFKCYSTINMVDLNLYDDNENYLRNKRINPFEETAVKRIHSNKSVMPFKIQFKTRSEKLLTTLKKRISVENSLVKGVFFELEPNRKTREYMEDYINIENNYNLEKHHQIYVLCDGHSGNKAAEIVVKELPALFFKSLIIEKDKDSKSEIKKEVNICENAIYNSFIKMDEKLQFDLVDDSSGCCTNLIYLCKENKKRVAYSGNIGDSRSILIREIGALRLSYDHKACDKTEQKRVKEEGGVILRKRLYGTLAVTRTHGDFEMKETVTCLSNKPHITRTEIDDTDKFIVIASDGIWDVIKDQDVFDIVKSPDFNTLEIITNKRKDLAKLLVKKAVELGSKDNISCIAIKLN